MKSKTLLRFGLILCFLFTAVSLTFAQGTAFTYQGRLSAGGGPANGSYDLTFALFDAGTLGNQVGSTLTSTATPVSNGLFTVTLDFGNQFPGAPRWLEIGVRTNGAGGYATLAPRQPLTPSPYAITAESIVLPFAVSRSVSTSQDAFWVTNGLGNGLHGSGVNGVVGDSAVNNGNGVLGICNQGSFAYGVWGESSTGYGVVGTQTANNNQGILGTLSEGVNGSSAGQFVPARGVYGVNTYYGNYGELGTTGEGVYGWGNNNSIGVNGQTVAGTGVNGVGYNGVWGTSSSANGNGVRGECDNGNNAYGVWGLSSTGWAGTFSGNAQVTGNFYGGAKFFRIDHPLDPANKTLIHASVESDEMKNVYDGVATLDNGGEAWVQLPAWFESLNTSFRYQLTCIGEPALIFIKQKISGNRFLISGGKPGLEVSWQVTGVRQDAYAKAHPMSVEVEKKDAERGRYFHPEAFGLPETKGLDYERRHRAEPAAPRP